jgi:hypothetical protein
VKCLGVRERLHSACEEPQTSPAFSAGTPQTAQIGRRWKATISSATVESVRELLLDLVIHARAAGQVFEHRHPFDQFHHFARLRDPAPLPLGKEQPPLKLHMKHSFPRFDKFRFRSESAPQLSRQTDGLRFVPSGETVRDSERIGHDYTSLPPA